MIAATLALALALSPSVSASSNAAPRLAAAQDETPVRLAGTVVDDKGAPVAGAKVIVAWPAATGAKAIRQVSTTGAAGAFSAEAPADRGAPRLTVFADGFVFQAIEGAQGLDLKVVGERILEVAFDLRLPDGTAPDDAMIRLEYAEETELPPTLASWRGVRKKVIGKTLEATVTVYGGLYNLPSSSEPVSRWTSEPVALDALELESSTVRIDLVERQVLVVEVIGNEGQASFGRSNQVVLVKDADFDANPSRSMRTAARAMRPNQGGEAFLRSGSTRYLFDVEAGEYVVGYVRRGSYPGEWKRVTIGAGETRVELEIEDPEARGSVTVEVLDADGKPVEVNQVGIRLRHKGGSSSSSSTPMQVVGLGEYKFLRSTMDPSGYLGSEPDPSKTITLTFRAPGLGARDLQIEDDVDRYVLRFTPPIDLEIRPKGKDWRSFCLKIKGQDNGYEGVFDLSDTEIVKIEGVQGSVFTVEWVVPSEDHRARMAEWKQQGFPLSFVQGSTLGTETLDCSKRGQRVELAAPTAVTLVVDASAYEPRTVILLSSAAATRSNAAMSAPRLAMPRERRRFELEEGGIATFEGLPAGEYVLAADTWTKPMTIEVQADQTITFPRIEARRLRVTIDDVSGTLSESGLKPEDVIVGRGGERFADLETMKALQADAKEQLVAILVERDGEEIELELGPLGKSKDLGGSLAPAFED